MVKRAVGTKACLLGKAVTCRYLRQDNFLEVIIRGNIWFSYCYLRMLVSLFQFLVCKMLGLDLLEMANGKRSLMLLCFHGT